MSKSKHEAAAVVTHGDHEVITPPHKLGKAVRLGTPSDDPVARAEQALAQLSGEFSSWMNTECERLGAARDAVAQAGFTPKTREGLFHAAHDIKGHAATFGFAPAGLAADSLCRLIEHSPDLDRIPIALINQHVDAVRALIREAGRDDVAELARALNHRLREVTDEFLRRENAHRPDYLDGIVDPPLVPGE
jgi:hypothetical protein